MTIYKVQRTDNGITATVHKSPEDLKGRPLTHIPIHSPGGFEYGYAGSGPADLALAILANHFGETKQQVLAYWLRNGNYKGKGSLAIDLHQDFKSQTVALWSGESHTLTHKEIHDIVTQLMEDRAAQV